MITITTYAISSDYKSISLVIDAGTGNHFHTLELFLGDAYLDPTPIDLSSILVGTQTETLTITNVQLGLDLTETIKGIVTTHVIASDTTEETVALSNLYYANLCLANMIIANDAAGGWNDINTIYMLLKSVPIFIVSDRIEEAINAYDRVVAMMDENENYFVVEDIEPCTSGSGCWIINGTYVIN
jgi:hypothetical protein